MTTQLMTVEVHLPAEISPAIESAGVRDLSNEMKVTFVIELFRRGVFSLGKSAELANMPLLAFMDELHTRNIPIVTVTQEMVDNDVETLKRLGL